MTGKGCVGKVCCGMDQGRCIVGMCHADLTLINDSQFSRQLLPSNFQKWTACKISAFICVAKVVS